ncbi:MAG TPA: hypothetical protein VK155_05465 [Bacteroidales bacterium]|jgi:TolB-like protein/Tfp pilus assembly protein PilF|nr:hypothetical protein [Bacteroidales bacterium]
MASIFPGYEYDIFISYRQNDNLDGWVTDFVRNLEKELKATIKEPVSVYFDTNPEDGLLETYNVDKSLAGKLKSLILIPIISQTYCDAKSFAWQYEFCPFNKMAIEDQFGRDIKLIGGNVTSRILPVKIHGLDPEDKALLENELGTTLRSIEFIYKSDGVNRPLAPSDNPDKNLNKTFYRDQINKVANAIKEIITSLKKYDKQNMIAGVKEHKISPLQRKIIDIKTISVVLTILLLLFAMILFGSKLIKSSGLIEKSIAVLPFKNDSSSDSTEYFINGIQDEILRNLQRIKSFKRVISRTSTEQFRGSSMPTITEIGKKLGVNYIVQGSGQKYGKHIRLRVQLAKAGKENQLWSNAYEQEIDNMNDIFDIQSKIAQSIASELNTTISPEEKKLIEKIPTSNLTAWDLYQRGRDELPEFWIEVDDHSALDRAGKYYRKALQFDPTFADAYNGLAEIFFVKYKLSNYERQNYLDSVLILADRALSYNDQLSEAHFVKGSFYSATGSRGSATKEFDKALELNPNDWMAYYGKAIMNEFEDHVTFLENLYNALRINQNGKETPTIYRMIGGGFIRTGLLDNAKICFTKAYELDGDSSFYLSGFSGIERDAGNYQKSIEYCKRALINKINYYEVTLRLADNFYNDGKYRECLAYYEKLKYVTPQVAYAAWRTGSEKAEHLFNQIVLYSDSIIRSSRSNKEAIQAYYDLARIKAFKGDTSTALKYFKFYSQIKNCELWMLTNLKHDPLFDNIRNKIEFKQYQKDMENKYQTEHEIVEKWLEKKEMLF